MEIEDHILQLMVKMLTGTTTDEESQELSGLLKRNPGAFTLMQLLFAEWATDEQVSKEDSGRLFAQILSRIKEAEVKEANIVLHQHKGFAPKQKRFNIFKIVPPCLKHISNSPTAIS